MAIQKISLEDDEFKLAFIQGTLAIDCLEITLTQNATDSPRIYTAAGSIFASPENGAEARLVWKRDSNHPYNQFAILNAMQRVKSGELIRSNAENHQRMRQSRRCRVISITATLIGPPSSSL